MPKRAKIRKLKDLHAKISSDPNVRASFIQDPVTYLQDCGVTLSPAAEKDLIKITKDLKGAVDSFDQSTGVIALW